MRFWFSFSVGVQTPTEKELSLKTPRPVAILSVRKRSDSNTVLSVRKRSDSNTVLSVRKRSDSNTVLSVRKRSDSNNNTRLSDQHHVAAAALALRFRTKNICWPKASGRNYAKAKLISKSKWGKLFENT